jgi:hypothetical protein
MLDQTAASAALDRRTVAGFLRRAIAAADALPRAGLHRRLAVPAGIPLELWFDDEAEADLAAARLASAAPDTEPAELTTLYTLRGASIGLDLLPPWSDAACDAAEFNAILAEAGLRGAYPFREHQWLALDLSAANGVQLARSPADLPDWFAGAPLRQHLHWLLRERGGRIAHAASLGLNGRGILILGHGGAGKSGTALAGVAAGLQTVGDDYVALGGRAPAVARPLFRVMKQDRAGLARLPGLTERTAHLPLNWKDKVEFDPTEIYPDCFADAVRIEAIVLPHVAHAAVPRFVSAGAGEAMRSLMRTNLYQFPGEAEDGLEYYAGLSRSVPVRRLELSDKAPDNGAVLADFVAALG